MPHPLAPSLVQFTAIGCGLPELRPEPTLSVCLAEVDPRLAGLGDVFFLVSVGEKRLGTWIIQVETGLIWDKEFILEIPDEDLAAQTLTAEVRATIDSRCLRSCVWAGGCGINFNQIEQKAFFYEGLFQGDFNDKSFPKF